MGKHPSIRYRMFRAMQRFEPGRVAHVDTVIGKNPEDHDPLIDYVRGTFGREPGSELLAVRLRRYYEAHAPGDLPALKAKVMQAVERSGATGVHEAMQAVIDEHGGALEPQPPAPASAPEEVEQQRALLTEYYASRSVAKTPEEVQAALDRYGQGAGFDAMWAGLQSKYGPAPASWIDKAFPELQGGAAPLAPQPAPQAQAQAQAPAAAPASAADTTAQKRRLSSFYQHYAPEKTSADIDKAVDKYAAPGSGGFEKMWGTLETKYGPEAGVPSPGAAAPAPAAASPAAPFTPLPAAPVAHPSAEEKSLHKRRLSSFYQHYAPDKVGDVDRAVDKYSSPDSGGFEKMWGTLESKYGPESSALEALRIKEAQQQQQQQQQPQAQGGQPPAAAQPAVQPGQSGAWSPSDAHAGQRRRLTSFYQHYAPEKVGDVDKAIGKYADPGNGGFDLMWRTLESKYGPEAAVPQPASEQAPAYAAPQAASSAPQPEAAPAEAAEKPKESVPMKQRRRLTSFYQHYAPDKSELDINKAIAKFADPDSGGFDKMWGTLERKYGPLSEVPDLGDEDEAALQSPIPEQDSPAPEGAADPHRRARSRLTAYYNYYAPEKTPADVDKAIARYAKPGSGGFEKMFRSLEQKYGPEARVPPPLLTDEEIEAAVRRPVVRDDGGAAAAEAERQRLAAIPDGFEGPEAAAAVDAADEPTAPLAFTPPSGEDQAEEEVELRERQRMRLMEFYRRRGIHREPEQVENALDHSGGDYPMMWARLAEKYCAVDIDLLGAAMPRADQYDALVDYCFAHAPGFLYQRVLNEALDEHEQRWGNFDGLWPRIVAERGYVPGEVWLAPGEARSVADERAAIDDRLFNGEIDEAQAAAQQQRPFPGVAVDEGERRKLFRRLRRFYAVHAPYKTEREMLETLRQCSSSGHSAATFFENLVKKYGPEPSITAATAAETIAVLAPEFAPFFVAPRVLKPSFGGNEGAAARIAMENGRGSPRRRRGPSAEQDVIPEPPPGGVMAARLRDADAVRPQGQGAARVTFRGDAAPPGGGGGERGILAFADGVGYELGPQQTAPQGNPLAGALSLQQQLDQFGAARDLESPTLASPAPEAAVSAHSVSCDPRTLRVTLRIAGANFGDYAASNADARRSFRSAVAEDLAASTGQQVKFFSVAQVRAGSVLVDCDYRLPADVAGGASDIVAAGGDSVAAVAAAAAANAGVLAGGIQGATAAHAAEFADTLLRKVQKGAFRIGATRDAYRQRLGGNPMQVYVSGCSVSGPALSTGPVPALLSGVTNRATTPSTAPTATITTIRTFAAGDIDVTGAADDARSGLPPHLASAAMAAAENVARRRDGESEASAWLRTATQQARLRDASLPADDPIAALAPPPFEAARLPSDDFTGTGSAAAASTVGPSAGVAAPRAVPASFLDALQASPSRPAAPSVDRRLVDVPAAQAAGLPEYAYRPELSDTDRRVADWAHQTAARTGRGQGAPGSLAPPGMASMAPSSTRLSVVPSVSSGPSTPKVGAVNAPAGNAAASAVAHLPGLPGAGFGAAPGGGPGFAPKKPAESEFMSSLFAPGLRKQSPEARRFESSLPQDGHGVIAPPGAPTAQPTPAGSQQGGSRPPSRPLSMAGSFHGARSLPDTGSVAGASAEVQQQLAALRQQQQQLLQQQAALERQLGGGSTTGSVPRDGSRRSSLSLTVNDTRTVDSRTVDSRTDTRLGDTQGNLGSTYNQATHRPLPRAAAQAVPPAPRPGGGGGWAGLEKQMQPSPSPAPPADRWHSVV